MPVTRRKLIWIALVLALMLAGIALALTVTPFSVYAFGYGTGSPTYALEWKRRLEPLSDPDVAHGQYPEVVVKRFDNGEWVFGVCADSHTSHRGGTIVFKDSDGTVRAFFGHVCGSEALEYWFKKKRSLQDFYSSVEWTNFHFTEYQYP